MKEYQCLNCKNETTDNFCPSCGQKTTTHRYSFKHIIMHDFIHGIFHLDKGFLFTTKELLTRPGHNIREYIQGKRIKQFNYFTLFIIIIALSHFIGKYSIIETVKLYNKEQVDGYLELAKDYDKILKVLSVPLWALVLFLFFRKSKQNYIEMIILSMYMLCGMLLINLFYIILLTFYDNIEVLKRINIGVTVMIGFYFTYFIFQYFSAFNYNKVGLMIRSIFASVIIILLQSIVLKLINDIAKLYF